MVQKRSAPAAAYVSLLPPFSDSRMIFSFHLFTNLSSSLLQLPVHAFRSMGGHRIWTRGPRLPPQQAPGRAHLRRRPPRTRQCDARHPLRSKLGSRCRFVLNSLLLTLLFYSRFFSLLLLADLLPLLQSLWFSSERSSVPLRLVFSPPLVLVSRRRSRAA